MSALLQIRVVPNAKKTEVAGVYGEGLKIKLHAPPVDGKANAALIDFLAKKLDWPSGKIAVKSGEKARTKLLEISGMEEAEARRRLLE